MTPVEIPGDKNNKKGGLDSGIFCHFFVAKFVRKSNFVPPFHFPGLIAVLLIVLID